MINIEYDLVDDGRNEHLKIKYHLKRNNKYDSMPYESYPSYLSQVGLIEGIFAQLATLHFTGKLSMSIGSGHFDFDGNATVFVAEDGLLIKHLLEMLYSNAYTLAWGYKGKYKISFELTQATSIS